jgi:hypothetical protein
VASEKEFLKIESRRRRGKRDVLKTGPGARRGGFAVLKAGRGAPAGKRGANEIQQAARRRGIGKFL